MTECHRCGRHTVDSSTMSIEEGVFELCDTCHAEVLEWLHQDGVYQPLF